MSRQQHDMANDHFPDISALAEQIADGTPTADYVPISNGPGVAATWGPASGGSSVHLENDDTTFADPGVVFKDGANYIGAEGNDATQNATIIFSTDLIESYSQSANDVFAYVDVSSSLGVPDVDIYVQSSAGTFFADLFLDASDGSFTFYGSGPITINPAVIMVPNLPTSDPSNPGQLWNDSGTLKVSI